MSDPPPVAPAPIAVAPDHFPEIAERVAAIAERARVADGHPSLNEAAWRDLERPSDRSAGFLVDDVAYAHIAPSDTFAPQHWELGIVVAPNARDRDLITTLTDLAAAHVRDHGGGRIVSWVQGVDEQSDEQFVAASLLPARDLYEIRVALPIAETPKLPPRIELRTFTPGRDEAAWLEVNNRAFANHAEQGGWIEATLARRMAEPWFDPKLFLLAFDDNGLAGFNWLKIHDAHGRDPQLGEIFVIGVDPRMQGTGLGRALAISGLALVSARGITTGSLFTAADNAPALRLYRSLGFTVHRTDRAYERVVDPA